MGLNNPQGQFEDSIFGPNGTHPTPGSLPYPTQPLKTIYGDTIEYLIPDGQKEKVLKKLYPFGDPPPLNDVWMDIHAHREFRIGDFKVVEQNGYVMPVSPYFAEDGASVVDWQPKSAAEDSAYVAAVPDEAAISAYSAGQADGFMGLPKGTSRPSSPEGMAASRRESVQDAYEQGYEDGCRERMDNQDLSTSVYTSTSNRRTGRRPKR